MSVSGSELLVRTHTCTCMRENVLAFAIAHVRATIHMASMRACRACTHAQARSFTLVARGVCTRLALA
eukprot:1268775-Pleurochrysis_carterae.AAC.1